MSNLRKIIKEHWPVIIGLLLTTLYLVIIIPVTIKYKSVDSLNTLGDFLSGLFAPLAFLWLFMGYLQNSISIKIQSDELRHSVSEMQTSNETSKAQLQSVESNEKHARRDLFLRYADLHAKTLEAHAKQILRHIEDGVFHSALGKNDAHHYRPGHGDVNLMLIEGAESIKERLEIYKSIPSSHRNSPQIVEKNIFSYISEYETLIKRAKKYDNEGELEELFSESPYFKFYNSLILLKNNFFKK